MFFAVIYLLGTAFVFVLLGQNVDDPLLKGLAGFWAFQFLMIALSGLMRGKNVGK